MIGRSVKEDGTKVLEKMVRFLFEKQFLSTISWTGRGKSDVKKICFSHYVNLRQFLLIVVRNADDSYTEDKVTNKLIYSIFKHASLKVKRSNSTSVAR